MRICHSILVPVTVVVRFVVRVVREIVRTVCEWVTSVITVVKEVCEEVCGWLGPFSFLCDWVCKLVEVVETVTEWVCREVIERIFEWIEIILEYVFYILTWVCWVIDWIPRLPALLLCRLGFSPRRILRICVKILTDERGTPAIPVTAVQAMIGDAAAIFARCNIDLVVVDTVLVEKAEFLDGTTCEFGGMFSDFFSWFSRRACHRRCTVTVYFVRDITSASGCAYPGTNWVTVDAQGDGTTVVQEIGHLADLWGHSDDPNNVMTDQPGGTHDQITEWQCCMIRTSRFTCPSHAIEMTHLELEEATVPPIPEPVHRKAGPPESKETSLRT